jgi:hypothetical protein
VNDRYGNVQSGPCVAALSGPDNILPSKVILFYGAGYVPQSTARDSRLPGSARSRRLSVPALRHSGDCFAQ